MVTESDRASVLDERYFRPTSNAKYVDNCIELLRSRSMAEMVAERMPDSVKLAAGELQTMVTARPVRETDVIELAAVAPSREAAVAAANAYVDVYKEYDLEQSRAEAGYIRAEPGAVQDHAQADRP